MYVIVIDGVAGFQTTELGNGVLQLGSVDAPLFHMVNLDTGSICLYLVQLVTNKETPFSKSDTCAWLKLRTSSVFSRL
jgi:hypothetical protein